MRNVHARPAALVALVGLVALALLAGCSPGAAPPASPASSATVATPKPLTGEVLPPAAELGEGWVREPVATSPPPDPGPLCAGAPSPSPAVPVAYVSAGYGHGPWRADVSVKRYASSADAARHAAESIARVDGCGATFTFVSGGASLPATSETVAAPVPGGECRKLSLSDRGETGWFAICWVTAGPHVVVATSMTDDRDASSKITTTLLLAAHRGVAAL